MSTAPSVVILGGGLSGMAAGYALARAGWPDVTLVERGSELGGLAGTFESGGHFYPLAYHHILHRDRTLLHVLDRIGALERVRWRKIRMLFRVDGTLYDLADPLQFLRFPMSLPDKLRFARLMLRSFRKSDWTDWKQRSAAELVDAWAGPGVRRAIFEPLTRLKFDLPCSDVSGAWLGARLHFREGSAPLGFIPGCNWTQVLCEGLGAMLGDAGVTVRTGAGVCAIHSEAGRVREIELDGGERLRPQVVVCTLPTEVYRAMSPGDSTPGLDAIRYTAVVSAIFATSQTIPPDFYWMNLASLDCSASGLFRLEALNPSIGAPGESCFNFVTHVRSRHDEFFSRSEAALQAGYLEDFRRIFGVDLEPSWSRIHRLPMYSPVFVRGYDNPPVRSTQLPNLYFAGNYRTFPSIASTGTAMRSGFETAHAVLTDHGTPSALLEQIGRFRLRSMPRA